MVEIKNLDKSHVGRRTVKCTFNLSVKWNKLLQMGWTY